MLDALELTDLMLERRLFLEPFMLERRGMPTLTEDDTRRMPDGGQSPLLEPLLERRLFLEPFMLDRSGMPRPGEVKLAEEADLLTWCTLPSRPGADDEDVLLPTGLES